MGITSSFDGNTTFTVIESFGAIKVVRDAAYKIYIQIGNNTPVAVKLGGTQIVQGGFSGWETLGAETVASVNQVMWKNTTTNTLSLWTLDSNWNWTASTGNWGLNSAEAMQQEINFQQDFNGDGNIGAGVTVTLSLSPDKVLEDGAANLVYTFTRTGSLSAPLTVTYTVAGTATLGTDYTGIALTPASKSITFVAGSATATLIVDPTADGELEPDETVALTLQSGTGYGVGTAGAVVGTIQNDESGGGFQVIEAAGATKLVKDGQNKLFSQVGNGTPIAVKYGGTQIVQGGFSGWETLGVETVAGVNQVMWKNAATNLLSLWRLDNNWNWTASAGNWGLNSAEAMQQEINFQQDFNNDGNIGARPVITLSIAPGNVLEDGAANLIYTFTRTGFTGNGLTVNYSVAGTATLGTDYSGIAVPPGNKSITFAAGSATATLTVDPTADGELEPDETVELTLVAEAGYIIGTPTTVAGTIANDDLPVINLILSPGSVFEDGSNNLVYTFTRTGSTTNPLSVNYTVGGTATLGSDYTGIATTGSTKTITFAEGASTAFVTVDPLWDLTMEPNETVNLTLAPGSGYSIGTTTPVSGTIRNDDTALMLYNATASSLPSQQGWLAFGTGLTGSQTRTASGVRLNSSVLMADLAGYSNVLSSSPTLVNSAFPALDRSVGFALDFRLQVLRESHQSDTRAGFAVILMDQGPTPRGIELGFWSNSIFSQAGGSTPFQASAERMDGINTTIPTSYNLRILDQNYYLLANNRVVLAGSLQDYSQWQKSPLLPYNPYTTPNFLFLGDNSSSASGSVELGSINLGVPVAGGVDDDALTGTGVAESFNGLQGADVIKGNGGNDWLAGSDGDDTLNGGTGDDLLIGGRGADRFLFQWSAPLDSNPLGVDTIMDFNPAEDRLVLERNTFAILPPDPQLPASAFAVVNSDGDAALSTAVIAYNSLNGGVFYNPNGAAPGFGETSPNGLFTQLWGGSNGLPAPLLSSGMVEII